MLVAFRKKFISKSQSNSFPNDVRTGNNPNGGKSILSNVIDPSLRKKFARGIQYNLKLLIKGDRNVGKTCLFNRLQGKPFLDEYLPTEEIQAASIQWNYKATDDVIKVDVWDVVDRSRIKRKKVDGLKLNNHIHQFEDANLDAQFIDVYKDAQGVILMFDVTKAWTWEYVQRELQTIPPQLPILVLANRLDMNHHRQVTHEQAVHFIENIDRPFNSAGVKYAESSMRNGFGLKLIYLFINIPFLVLQKQTLERQLATNSREIELSLKELDLFAESDENDYEKFSQNLNERRRMAAESVAPKPTIDVPINEQGPDTQVKEESRSPAKKAVDNGHTPQSSPEVADDLHTENFEEFLGAQQLEDLNLKREPESDDENPFNSMVMKNEEDLDSLTSNGCCTHYADKAKEENVYAPEVQIRQGENCATPKLPSVQSAQFNEALQTITYARKDFSKDVLHSPLLPTEPTDPSSNALEQWLDTFSDTLTPSDPKPHCQGDSTANMTVNRDNDSDDEFSPNPFVSSRPDDLSNSDGESMEPRFSSRDTKRSITDRVLPNADEHEQRRLPRKTVKLSSSKTKTVGDKKIKKPKSKVNNDDFFGQSASNREADSAYEEL